MLRKLTPEEDRLLSEREKTHLRKMEFFGFIELTEVWIIVTLVVGLAIWVSLS